MIFFSINYIKSFNQNKNNATGKLFFLLLIFGGGGLKHQSKHHNIDSPKSKHHRKNSRSQLTKKQHTI